MSPLGRALACALVCALGLAACRSTPEALEAPDDGFLKALALPEVGARQAGPVELSGQVVLVNFFATWCFPCMAEVPTLEALQKTYGPQGFRVVAVGMDLEGEKVLVPFADYHALNYTVLVADETIRSGQSVFGPIIALPTSFLLDRQGRAVGGWQGVASHEVMAKAIEKTLERSR
jgi:thiol-disulfide isomerase/thioredoxin